MSTNSALFRTKVALFLNYFVFAILLNSVGTVILQVQNNFDVAKGSAAVLEGFKDLSIAITSFLIASYVVRIGYKRTMLIGLGLVSVICLLTPSVPSFFMTKMLFMSIGISFALIKVSVYSTLSLVTTDQKEHLSLMNFIESFFMVGIVAGSFIFGALVDDSDPKSTAWFNVYYGLGALSFLAFLFLFSTKMDESSIEIEPKSMEKEFLSVASVSITMPSSLSPSNNGKIAEKSV